MLLAGTNAAGIGFNVLKAKSIQVGFCQSASVRIAVTNEVDLHTCLISQQGTYWLGNLPFLADFGKIVE